MNCGLDRNHENITVFLQHLSEVVHIPHTKMQKYTDIHDYLHITEGNYGNALVSRFSRRTDHFRSHCSYSAETRTRDNAPVCQRPLRHCSRFGFSQRIRFTQTPRVCRDGSPGCHTNAQDRAGCTCSLSKLHQTGAGGAQCLPPLSCTARSSAQTWNICTRPKLCIPMTFGAWVRFIAKVKLASS